MAAGADAGAAEDGFFSSAEGFGFSGAGVPGEGGVSPPGAVSRVGCGESGGIDGPGGSRGPGLAGGSSGRDEAEGVLVGVPPGINPWAPAGGGGIAGEEDWGGTAW